MAINIPRIAPTYMARNLLKHAVSRSYSSCLFVSGRKGMEIFSFISPYLDFDDKLSNLDKFQENLNSRGLKINAREVKEVWELYKSVTADKSSVQLRMDEVGQQLKDYMREDLTAAEQEKKTMLRHQFLTLKEDFKAIRNVAWDMSESIVEKMLKLPNNLDERTPVHAPVVTKTVGRLSELQEVASKNHIEIGRNLGLLEYKNPMQYYLCNDAALFELGALSYAGKIFSEENMIRVMGSDFSRSLVVEGTGLNHEDPMHAFVIDNHGEGEKKASNYMHLVGGASLMSFLAMHSKQMINPNYFPLRYFATGRQYTPFPATSTSTGLFTVCQSSVAHVFAMVKDGNSLGYQEQFEKLLNTVSNLYDNVCDHYQVVVRSASELKPWESMRVSFELWSPYSKQYIEVGHISMCGSYFSKRLLIAYPIQGGRDYPSVISGTVMSVPRLLGCLLEQDSEKFVIPKKIAECTPVDHSVA
ncbi:serine--tRNA synthetase-like protein Slimp [Lasioglossum baleicum]|uniref:serine--tRNA synthetase-like protein Slimp n=1 Tax=Lasioglossum baleicum TaxID=434251 RepID=UPI003FCCA5CF